MNILEHGREMSLITLEGVLNMAKVIKECNGDLDEMISYLEKRVKEEANVKEQECEA